LPTFLLNVVLALLLLPSVTAAEHGAFGRVPARVAIASVGVGCSLLRSRSLNL
jgi:ABC-type phosphate transport system permease subunit